MTLLAIAVHTCPVWQDPDGSRRPGFDTDPGRPLVVGWCNVLVVEVDGEQHRLLIGAEASR